MDLTLAPLSIGKEPHEDLDVILWFFFYSLIELENSRIIEYFCSIT
jgi:hypothetical protein